MTIGRLDYLYTPSDDVAADLRFLVDVLGGEAAFAIEDGGIRVAMVSFARPPAILLTDHLEGDRPIHVYAVEDLAMTTRELEERGWARDRAVELPPGPAVNLSANVTAYADVALSLGARYEYRVRAAGLAGASSWSNVATATAPATSPETMAPVVSIISPVAWSTVSGRVSVQIRATDDIGVVRVELVVDTQLVGACALGAAQTYACKWDTRKWSDGGWTLYARAWDKAGNMGVHAITVFVHNARRR